MIKGSIIGVIDNTKDTDKDGIVDVVDNNINHFGDTSAPTVTPTPTPTVTPAPVGCMIKANNDVAIKVTSYKGTVISILENDGCVKECGAIKFTQGKIGTVSIDDGGTANNLSDDVLIYTPEANIVNKTDSFQYTITDCKGNSSTATVTLDIQCTSTQTSDGDTMSKTAMILMMILTGMIGLVYVRREENIR